MNGAAVAKDMVVWAGAWGLISLIWAIVLWIVCAAINEGVKATLERLKEIKGIKSALGLRAEICDVRMENRRLRGTIKEMVKAGGRRRR